MDFGLNLCESCSVIVLHLKCRELLILWSLYFTWYNAAKVCPKCLVAIHIRKVCCDCGHVLVLRRTTQISKSRKLEKRADLRALEAEIHALNCRKHVKEQIVAKRYNETGEEKAKCKRAIKTSEEKAKRRKDDIESKVAKRGNETKITKVLITHDT